MPLPSLQPHTLLSTHNFELLKILFYISTKKAGSATLNRPQAKAAFVAIGLSIEILDERSHPATAHDDPYKVDLEEFCRLFHFAMLERVFAEIDSDDSGDLTSEELKHALEKFGHKSNALERRNMIRHADKDGDGKISMKEFKEYFQNVPSESFRDVMELWMTSNVEHNLDNLAFFFYRQSKRDHHVGQTKISIPQVENAFKEMGLRGANIHVLLENESKAMPMTEKAAGVACVSFQEFCTLYHKAKLRAEFDEIDFCHKGMIDVDEITATMQQLGYSLSKEQCSKMLDDIDVNKDGLISFEEFQAFFESVPAQDLEELVGSWAGLSGVSFPVADAGSKFCLQYATASRDLHWWQTLLVGGTAGCVARTLTAPFEVVETLQQAKRWPSAWQAARGVWRRVGLRGLWAGNLLNCAAVFPRAGAIFVLNSKVLLPAALPPRPPGGGRRPWEGAVRFSCAAAAALAATTLVYPLQLLRTRQIVYGSGPGGDGRYPDLRALAVAAARERPWGLGFYQGLGVALAELVPFVAVQVAALEGLKAQAAERGLPPSAPVLFGAGAAAGFAAQTAVYPLTVLRTRLQLQASDFVARGGGGRRREGGPSSSAGAEARALLRGGWRGLFRGIGPTYLKLLPGVGVATAVSARLREGCLAVNGRAEEGGTVYEEMVEQEEAVLWKKKHHQEDFRRRN